MPTYEPPLRPEEIDVEQLDVIGHHERRHLSHVGFAWTPAQVSEGNEVTIIDARPVRRSSGKLAVHAIGRLQLSRRERLLMTTWLERRKRTRTLAGDHVTIIDGTSRDHISGRIISRFHSCAGLVYECLRRCAKLELVALAGLPRSDRERLVTIWGDKVVELAEHRGELVGEGPWEVLLPAHVLHALARDDPREGPLLPTPLQWDFP